MNLKPIFANVCNHRCESKSIIENNRGVACWKGITLPMTITDVVEGRNNAAHENYTYGMIRNNSIHVITLQAFEGMILPMKIHM